MSTPQKQRKFKKSKSSARTVPANVAEALRRGFELSGGETHIDLAAGTDKGVIELGRPWRWGSIPEAEDQESRLKRLEESKNDENLYLPYTAKFKFGKPRLTK